jgi:cell wall-associated NlpC family hydrolase
MSKHILFAATIIITFLCLGAVSPVQAQRSKKGTTQSAKKDVKFLNEITVEIEPVQTKSSDPKASFPETLISEKKTVANNNVMHAVSIENASELQLKYALLLDVEVEQTSNLNLFRLIDEWMGTRYRLGGSSKDGIDCSALMQILFTSLYGISLPRTAREQYQFSKKISRTELKEGDLVFFNTVGGVSHVGMYLQNNKFIHASSGGVTISDLYEEYWLKRFIGVGRVDQVQQSTVSTLKP